MKTARIDPPRVAWARTEDGRNIRLRIIGENSINWITSWIGLSLDPNYAHRFPKRSTRMLSDAEVIEVEWDRENRERIAKLLSAGNDPSILRQIAALIGYKESK
jgi:hypothetical protein